jgi:sugar phosphate isomerase/epimerase
MLTRRDVLNGLGLAAFASSLPSGFPAMAEEANCPFRMAVINDEISPDFELACKIVAHDFGFRWIELRSMWGTNVTALSAKQIEDARKILAEHKLRVTDIASPLFKTDWPGAPLSSESEKRDQFHADFDFKEQDKLLEHCLELCKAFETDRIRCFDFWRLADQGPYRAPINAKLKQAAERCAQEKIVLLLENEMSCNTATGPEAAAVLAAIPNSNFMLNWDPGNAEALRATPFPDGYALLPKQRIGHCHVKDVTLKPDGKYEWAPVGGGVVDWVGQLKALAGDGFHYGLSLETHWKGGGSPEQCTRTSMAGLKQAMAKAGLAC